MAGSALTPAKYSHCVVVVGGIGVTPFLALVDELLELPEDRRPYVDFIWSTREPNLMRHFEARIATFAEHGVRVSCHITGGGDRADSAIDRMSRIECD